jgi:hypothetical protein
VCRDVAGDGRRFASGQLRFGRLLELDHLALEVGEILEALVHRRESQIRDVVETAQPFQHGDADAIAADLAALGAKLLLDLRGECLYGVVVEPAGRGVFEAVAELLPVERLVGAIALANHDAELVDPLVGREPPTTGEALAPAPDRRAVLAGA